MPSVPLPRDEFSITAHWLSGPTDPKASSCVTILAGLRGRFSEGLPARVERAAVAGSCSGQHGVLSTGEILQPVLRSFPREGCQAVCRHMCPEEDLQTPGEARKGVPEACTSRPCFSALRLRFI